MSQIATLLAQRIALSLLLLFLVSILIFAGTIILPGDVAQSILGQSATPAADRAGDLRGIEAALTRIAEDLNAGREEMLVELRSDLLVLTRAVRAARFGDPFRDDQLPPLRGHRGPDQG